MGFRVRTVLNEDKLQSKLPDSDIKYNGVRHGPLRPYCSQQRTTVVF